MIKNTLTQSDSAANHQAVDLSVLTVDYWRERFAEKLKSFETLTALATELDPLDDDFKGPTGFQRLNNIRAGRGGLEITAKAVQYMDQLRPAAKPAPPSKITRQKLNKT